MASGVYMRRLTAECLLPAGAIGTVQVDLRRGAVHGKAKCGRTAGRHHTKASGNRHQASDKGTMQQVIGQKHQASQGGLEIGTKRYSAFPWTATSRPAVPLLLL